MNPVLPNNFETVTRRSWPDPERMPIRPTRILVADDEHLVSLQLTLALAELGFTTVGPAVNGEDALKLAETARPDIALLDIRMPKVDGIATARQIFDDFCIPVIIVSAYSDDASLQGAVEAGVFGYLIKPASREQVRVAIEVGWANFLNFLHNARRADTAERKLEERKFIEQAKWILVSQRSMTEPDAMRWLQKSARDTRRPLLEIAQHVLREHAASSPSET